MQPRRLGLDTHRPLSCLRAAGVDPVTMLTGPILATSRCLSGPSGGSTRSAFEVNEAFASVIGAWQAEVADPALVNLSAELIAPGDPVGASGAVLMTRLVHHRIRASATACRPCARAAAWPAHRPGSSCDAAWRLLQRRHEGALWPRTGSLLIPSVGCLAAAEGLSPMWTSHVDELQECNYSTGWPRQAEEMMNMKPTRMFQLPARSSVDRPESGNVTIHTKSMRNSVTITGATQARLPAARPAAAAGCRRTCGGCATSARRFLRRLFSRRFRFRQLRPMPCPAFGKAAGRPLA